MAWYHRAKVGDKVVCIIKDWGHRAAVLGIATPAYSGVYTIRGLIVTDRGPSFTLEEIRNSPREFIQGWLEPHFSAKGFRPIQSSSTEKHVAELKKLLNSSPVKETEPA